ncbi:MBL fold metallo-hydrolase [Patescibacteria group bacterium]|nr:MBL fold metallo-hydrolase [Patescibacteria group bacterium]
MQIIFLGTGPSVAIPRKGHRDPVCSAARKGGKSRRGRSAALVFDAGKTILIDAGPDIFEQLTKNKPKRIDLVLLTHGHADAAGGIRDLSRWISKHMPGETVPVYTDVTTKRRLGNRLARENHLKFHHLRAYKTIRSGRSTILPFPVKHSFLPGFPTFGFRFGKRLAYASDVRLLPPKSKGIIKNIDTFVLDAAAYLKRRIPSHLGADQAIALAQELKIKHLILTQIGHTYPPHELAERQLQSYLKQQKTRRPSQVRLAFDRMQINL